MIKKIFFNKKIMIYVLIGMSILMYCSFLLGVIIGSAKIIGVGLTLWGVTVFWNLHIALNSNNMDFGTIVSVIDDEYEIAKVNKKRGKQLLYGITVPMMCLGIIMVVILIISYFIIL